MITENDLRQAIAECHGERNPNANTCMKLAAFYTIQDHMRKPDISGISFTAAESQPRDGITYQSGTDFSHAVNGENSDDVIAIVDDLMNTLRAVCPRLYRVTLQHFRDIKKNRRE